MHIELAHLVEAALGQRLLIVIFKSRIPLVFALFTIAVSRVDHGGLLSELLRFLLFLLLLDELIDLVLLLESGVPPPEVQPQAILAPLQL